MYQRVLARAENMDESWTPPAHVRHGWEVLHDDGKAIVRSRLAQARSSFKPAEWVSHTALRRFFSFLSQVEVIAIEVPLSALPTAKPETKRLLEQQLVDEVFHAMLFADLARCMGGLDKPIQEAEALLDQIRKQDDPHTTAVLLNLIAEGWIENLFNHAATWDVAGDVFQMVLQDESRHVEEAHHHMDGMDLRKVGDAVRMFEEQLFRLLRHPRVGLPILALAGEARFLKLGESFLATHTAALAKAGIEPTSTVKEMARLIEEIEATPQAPLPVEPESQWRRVAMHLWVTPRNPTINGWCEIRVDHIPKHSMTAVVVAAIGKVYAEYPRVNRYVHGGKIYQPASVNVGVRACLDNNGESLTTIIVPAADKRSINDIHRIVRESIKRINKLMSIIERVELSPDEDPLSDIVADDELMAMLPPGTIPTPVTVSNVGPSGLFAGFGAMPGPLGQSVEIIIGHVEKRPQWTGKQYEPVDTVIIGCSADHRVLDGIHAGEAMRRLREALSVHGVCEILDRRDTLTNSSQLEEVEKAYANVALLLSLFASCTSTTMEASTA